MDFKDTWEGLTTEYDKAGGRITFYATPNAEKAVREVPDRIVSWQATMHEGTDEFIRREAERLCISSRS